MDDGVGFISSAFLPLLLGNGGKAVMVPFFAERALKQQPRIVENMYCVPVQNPGRIPFIRWFYFGVYTQT